MSGRKKEPLFHFEGEGKEIERWLFFLFREGRDVSSLSSRGGRGKGGKLLGG